MDKDEDATLRLIYADGTVVAKRVPQRHYDNIELLCEALHYTIYNREDSKGNPLPAVFHYNRAINHITLVVCPSETPVGLMGPPFLDLKFSWRLAYILGLDGKKQRSGHLTPYSRKDNKIEWIHVAAGPSNLRAGLYSMYVYCDVVARQVVGNVKAALLRVVNVQGSHTNIVGKVFTNPHYVPALKREFESVEINISDDAGVLVNFKYGKTFVKLHFKTQ